MAHSLWSMVPGAVATVGCTRALAAVRFLHMLLSRELIERPAPSSGSRASGFAARAPAGVSLSDAGPGSVCVCVGGCFFLRGGGCARLCDPANAMKRPNQPSLDRR